MKVDQPGRRAGLETREHSVMTDYLPTYLEKSCFIKSCTAQES